MSRRDGSPTPPLSSSDGRGVHCMVFRDGEPSRLPVNLTDLNEVIKEDRAFVWFDVVDPDPDDLAVLNDEFDLHPLAVEDAVKAHQRPKIEEYGSYWFVVVHATTQVDDQVRFHELSIFAGKRFLVTVRHDPAFPLLEIERRWRAHSVALRRDSGLLLYTILDTIVDGYFPVAETFQERIDDLETSLFQNRPFRDEVLLQIFNLKRDGQQFRRAALPMRDILNPLIRGDLGLIPEEELVYFRDVYDHAVRVIDQLDAVRDLVNSALEIHLSVVGNRQNEVSKQLTTIATIFLPMSFLTGFFGQNFGFLIAHIVGADSFWWLGIGSQVLTVVALLIFFKRRGWF